MNYKQTYLEEVCEISMGQAPSGDSYNNDARGMPLIAGAGDFTNGKANPSKFTTQPTKICEENDIILGIRASIGQKIWADKTYCLGRGVAGIRPKKSELHPHFLWHWLSSQEKILLSKARGATFKQVSKKDIHSLCINLPPLDEQRRIAIVLDKVNSLTKESEKFNNSFEKLISDYSLQQIRKSKSPNIKLGDLTEFITSGGRGWSKYFHQDGDYFIRSGDVQMGRLDLSKPQFVSPPDNAEAKRTKVKFNDVLLTITGSRIGRAASVKLDSEGGYISQHVALIRVNETKLLADFLVILLCMESYGQKQIRKFQYGQTKPGLNFSQISNFIFPLPSIDEQKIFLKNISVLKSNFKFLELRMERLFELRQSLNKNLLSNS